jgi:hypothetical protein
MNGYNNYHKSKSGSVGKSKICGNIELDNNPNRNNIHKMQNSHNNLCSNFQGNGGMNQSRNNIDKIKNRPNTPSHYQTSLNNNPNFQNFFDPNNNPLINNGNFGSQIKQVISYDPRNNMTLLKNFNNINNNNPSIANNNNQNNNNLRFSLNQNNQNSNSTKIVGQSFRTSNNQNLKNTACSNKQVNLDTELFIEKHGLLKDKTQKKDNQSTQYSGSTINSNSVNSLRLSQGQNYTNNNENEGFTEAKVNAFISNNGKSNDSTGVSNSQDFTRMKVNNFIENNNNQMKGNNYGQNNLIQNNRNNMYKIRYNNNGYGMGCNNPQYSYPYCNNNCYGNNNYQSGMC